MLENPGNDKEPTEPRPPVRDLEEMAREARGSDLHSRILQAVSVLIVAVLVIAAILGLGGCGVPREFAIERAIAAERIALQGEQAATEVDAMALKLVTLEADNRRLAKQVEFQTALNSISTPEQGVVLGMNYAKDLEEIEKNATAELQRLGQVSTKVRVTAEGTRMISRLADRESLALQQWEDAFRREVVPAIEKVIVAYQEYDADKRAKEEARLAKEAEETRRAEERRRAEEEAHAAAERERIARENANNGGID
jgi:hypothetical protein